MWGLLVETFPYALAAMAAAPIVLVVGALIIGKAQRPVVSGMVFVLGALLLDIVFAVVMLWLYKAAGMGSGSGDASAWVDVILGVLFVLVGLKAAVTPETPEAQAAQQAQAEKLATAKATTLLLAGVAVQIINSDALVVYAAGLKEIATAQPFPAIPVIVGVLAVFLFVMLIPYHLPTLLYIVSPKRAGGWMRSLSGWLLEHSRVLEIVVGLAFGAIFLWKGLTVLL